jgi:hypothetical protein
MNAWLRPVLTLAALLGAIAVNGYSNVNPPGGMNVGEMSNTIFADVLLTPASWAFTIWGLIYIGLIAFGLYQLLPAQWGNRKLAPHSYFLVLASLAQCLWIYLFLSQQFVLALIAMVEILLLLLALYLRINTRTWSLPRPPLIPRAERWLIHRPISLYFGWISIATVLNVALTLFSRGWGGWGLSPVFWTVVMMGVAAELGLLMLLRRQDGTFAMVVIWALVWIAVGNFAQPIIAIAGLGLAAALAVMVFAKGIRI